MQNLNVEKPQPKENTQRMETTQRIKTVSSFAFYSLGKLFCFIRVNPPNPRRPRSKIKWWKFSDFLKFERINH